MANTKKGKTSSGNTKKKNTTKKSSAKTSPKKKTDSKYVGKKERTVSFVDAYYNAIMLCYIFGAILLAVMLPLVNIMKAIG